MRPMYVTNSVVTKMGGYYVITFENDGRMCSVRLSAAQFSFLHTRIERAEPSLCRKVVDYAS